MYLLLRARCGRCCTSTWGDLGMLIYPRVIQRACMGCSYRHSSIQSLLPSLVYSANRCLLRSPSIAFFQLDAVARVVVVTFMETALLGLICLGRLAD